MYKCKLCENVEFESYTSLSRHMGLTHKISSDQFYVDYHLNGRWPTCKCGCGERMKYSYQLKSFRDYKKGHVARIHNNWGHNKKILLKSAETRRKQYATGERKVWNDGLTIEDSIVKQQIEHLTKCIRTPEERKNRSERMKKNRLNGTVPTLRGKDHSQWKGGVSDINVLARNRVRLYKEWKYPILVRDGFKCVDCGSNSNLHIHHDKEHMCDIVSMHIADNITPKSFEEKELIADLVVEYHIVNEVSGITLCSNCHNKLHPSLNF